MRGLSALILTVIISATGYCQTNRVIPSLSLETPAVMQPDAGSTLQTPLLNDSISFSPQISTLSNFEVPVTVPNTYNMNMYSRNPFTMANYNFGYLPLWENGKLIGSYSFNTLPALGNIARANLAISQTFGRVTVTGGISGEKNHIGPFLYNNFGVFGDLNWQINDKFNLNVFGTYFSHPQHIPAAMPFAGGQSYGATVGYNVNDRFRMEAGVQRSYDPFSRRWETVPVFIPSFKLNNGAEIGLDVGGILYQILHTISLENDTNYGPANMNGGGAPRKFGENSWRQKQY